MLFPFQTGIQVGSSAAAAPPITSYSNTGGQGNRSGVITGSSNITPDGGTAVSALFDGNFTAGSSTAWDMPGTGSTPIPDGAYVRFDFGSKKYIDEIKVFFDITAGSPSMGAWVWEGSDTAGSGYTVYGSFTWDAATETTTLTGVPSTGHRYWQMRKNGAGSNYFNYYFTEVEFKIAPGA